MTTHPCDSCGAQTANAPHAASGIILCPACSSAALSPAEVHRILAETGIDPAAFYERLRARVKERTGVDLPAAPSPPETPAREGSAVDPMLCDCGHPRAIHMPAWRDNVKTADSACFAPTPDGGRCCPCRKYAPASPASAPRETPPPPTTKEAIRRALSPEAQNVEARFLLDAVSRAIAGEDPGDFAASFPVVSDAMEIASRCASAECARDDHRASLVQYEKDWHRLMLLIAEVTGEEDPAAAVDDGFDPWSALGKMRFPPPEAPASSSTDPATKEQS